VANYEDIFLILQSIITNSIVEKKRRFKPHICDPNCWGSSKEKMEEVLEVLNIEKLSPFVIPWKLGFVRSAPLDPPFIKKLSKDAADIGGKRKKTTFIVSIFLFSKMVIGYTFFWQRS